MELRWICKSCEFKCMYLKPQKMPDLSYKLSKGLRWNIKATIIHAAILHLKK